MNEIVCLTANAAPAGDALTASLSCLAHVTTPVAGEPASSRMKIKQTFLSFVAVALALAGCISTPPAPEASPSHPASTQAAPSNYPLPLRQLLNITNMVAVEPVTETATEPEPAHEGHDAKPKGKKRK